jgi:hypothetical protein
MRGFDGDVNVYILYLCVMGLCSLVAGCRLHGGVQDGGVTMFVRNIGKPSLPLYCLICLPYVGFVVNALFWSMPIVSFFWDKAAGW